MKILIRLMSIILPAIIIISSCKKEETDNPPTPNDPLSSYTLIGTEEAGNSGYTIKLYLKESAFVGYNYVVARVVQNGTSTTINNALVEFKPMMHMTGMSHSCPVEQPMYNQDLNGYSGTTTFVMPSGSMGNWVYTVELTPPGSSDVFSVDFNIDVVEKPEPRLFSFTSDIDAKKVFVALVEPWDAEVGINNFHIVIYERQSMMMWPALNGLTIEIDPQMPSMGHGSPNNENPLFLDNGHYEGAVNFTMGGYWEVNLLFKDANGNVMKDDQFFEFNI